MSSISLNDHPTASIPSPEWLILLLSILPRLKIYTIVTFVVILCNGLGSTFVLVSSLYTRIRHKRAFTIDYRFPMYMAITDLGLFATFMANQVRISQFLNPDEPFFIPQSLPSPACEISAFIMYILIIMNSSLCVMMSLATYLAVYHKNSINLGKYDWRLFAYSLAFGLVTGSPGLPSIGRSRFACFIKSHSLFAPIAGTIWVSVSLIILVFCFIRIISLFRAQNSVKITLTGSDISITPRLSKAQRRLCRTVLVYTLILVVQWVPAIGTSLWPTYFGIENIDLFFITELCVNVGGVGNMIQYVASEGLHESLSKSYEDHNIMSTKHRVDETLRDLEDTTSNLHNQVLDRISITSMSTPTSATFDRELNFSQKPRSLQHLRTPSTSLNTNSPTSTIAPINMFSFTNQSNEK